MEKTLHNTIALITGGTKGIGKACAKKFADLGAGVIVCGRTQKNVSKTINEILQNGGRAWGAAVDAKSSDSIKQFFSQIVAKIGAVDILVNNVGGIEQFGGFLELTDNDWKNCFDLNFMSAVYFTRESMPYLKKSLHPRVINISTVAAKQPGYYNPHYTAAKAALLNLSKHLANVLAKDKILVNAICPSTIKTEVWKTTVENKMNLLKVGYDDAEQIYKKEEEEKTPLHQIGMPEDIAEMVVFLASRKAKWITGACFTVDGGTSRGIF